MISPISSHLSLSCPQLNHHLRTQKYIVPIHLSMPWPYVITKHSLDWVHAVLHTPSKAYTEHSIHWVLDHSKAYCLPLPDSFSSLISQLSLLLFHLSSLNSHLSSVVSNLSVDLIVLNTLHSHDYNETINYSLSLSCTSLPICCLQINNLQVLQSGFIVDS
jgi:hypothetical protein